MNYFSSIEATKPINLGLFKNQYKKRQPIQTQPEKIKKEPEQPIQMQSEKIKKELEQPMQMQPEKIKKEPEQPIQTQPEKIKKELEQPQVATITPLQQNGQYAVAKLEAELEIIKNEILPTFPIVRYLKNKCLEDATFATLVCKEEKTLSKCLSYTEKEVRKALDNKNGWLEDQQVYTFAEMYYLTEQIEEKVEEQNKNADIKTTTKKNTGTKKNKQINDKPQQLSL